MSVIFYDRLIVLGGLDKKLKKLVSSNDELQEMWNMVEELIHHKILGCVLDRLPSEKHTDFLDRFHQNPADEKLLDYLRENIQDDMEKIIKKESKLLAKEIIKEIRDQKKK